MIIIPKKSKILGRVPTKDDLEMGEIAINIAAGGEKIYTKNADGEIVLLGGSETYTLIDSSIAEHNTSSDAHSDIRDSITLTYAKDEATGIVTLASTSTGESLYPVSYESNVYDKEGVALDVNLESIREDIDKRNITYTDSESGLDSLPDSVDGTSITLGQFPVPSEEEEISETDTISTAIGKLYKMIKK